MEHLTENSIKKATLRFLKNYYKFRPRSESGRMEGSLDRQTDDGIIADGHLTFLLEDHTLFTATFEATSHDTRTEVLYKKQTRVLLWDSIAFAFLITAILFSINHALDLYTVNHVGWMVSLLMLLGVMVLCFALYRLLFGHLQRYRYIYAVEQFKRYHADEQWIAIGEDVFESSTDVNLEELKSQCVRNGFGLISVDRFQEPHLVITPSRQEVFGKQRAHRAFSSRNAAENRSKSVRFKGWLEFLIQKLGVQRFNSSTLRYQRTFVNQILLSAIAIILISGIFIREYQTRDYVVVDEKDYEKDLISKAEKIQAERKDYILDTSFVEKDDGKVEPYPVSEPTNQGVENNAQYGEISIATGDGDYVFYDCERFFSYIGTKYVIQEGIYDSAEQARTRSLELYKKGINANSLWMGCYDGGTEDYIVFIDFLFDSSDEANGIARSYTRRFRKHQINLEVRSVTM